MVKVYIFDKSNFSKCDKFNKGSSYTKQICGCRKMSTMYVH